ncbi:MAG TPA: hypothetical protein VJJ23_06120 [Candidatus Nanoarchaeia archaeon]|nr:hypothetical protein [Candidatus Woesearchaeota archaeon]HLC56787.1 hypothetical protein [Candidatus Nanoarchaeia archaeon]
MTTLKEKLERKKNKIGLVGTRLNFSHPKNGHGISEYITHDWKEIVIAVRENLDLAPDEETRRYLKKVNVQDPLETVATDLLYHGCGHRELPTNTRLGCPYIIKYHDLILDGIAKALKEKGKDGIIITGSDGSKQGLEGYVANAFEDVLDNVNARRNTRHAGQILFWNNEGLENNKKFTDFYEAFVKINLNLFGNAEDNTLLKRFYSNNDKIQKAVKEFKDYLKGKLRAGNLTRLYQKDSLFEKLFNPEDWREMAYRFALVTADLLENKPNMRLCFGVPADRQGYFDKLIRLPGTQEDLAYGRYKSGIGPSEHTEPLLQLDSLYRKISRAIPVKTSEYVKASEIPVAYFGRRNLKEDEIIKPKRIKGIGFDDEGNLALKVSKHEIQHPATYKVNPRNFPNLKIALLDTSGSMANSPDNNYNVGDTRFIPWGDNSKYHYALKGLYGIDNFLEKQGISAYVKSEVISFGSKTLGTGKRQLRSEEERRALLKKPSGGTVINPKVLEDSVNENCFLVSVSDGDIADWDQIKDNYKKIAERTDYCHIHIGSKNQFTQDLESWGIKVNYVKGNEDLSRLMLDATSKYYKGYLPK